MPTKKAYWRNPEKHRAKAREYALAHPEWKRESGRDWMRKKRAGMSPSLRQQKHLVYKQTNPRGYLLNHARQRAKRLGVPFDLCIDDIVIPAVCPVFGRAFEWGVGKRGWRNMWSPSLDRLKPDLGYVSENIRIISNRANHIKSNATLAEIEAVAAYMRRELG